MVFVGPDRYPTGPTVGPDRAQSGLDGVQSDLDGTQSGLGKPVSKADLVRKVTTGRYRRPAGVAPQRNAAGTRIGSGPRTV